MFPSEYGKLQETVSGRRALRYLEEVTQFHRIQVSDGFRQAAEHVAERLEGFGLQTEILTYTADGENSFWGQPPLPLEWDITRASLRLMQPDKHEQKLCDYGEDELSVIQRTGPTPPGGTTAEVVAVARADRPESYEDCDIEGRFVLCDADPDRAYRIAVQKLGAVGIIVDNIPEFPPVRQVMDLPDARCYRSFWFSRDDEPCPGFVLTPRQGTRLRRLLDNSDEPVRLRAEVEARFTAGQMQVVSALLPGETNEEVLVTAHLCHPRPSANDNASGVAAGMEAARALCAARQRGDLPRPQRGIRFLFLAEMAGTNAYLSDHEDDLSRWVAGLNLDMVGQDQDQCGSTLLAEHPPRATPSFSGDLAGMLIEWLGGQHKNLAGTATYADFRHDEAPFSGGSDHMILSDPAVGIPSPMIIQWPDRFYHTSEDRLDKVDPCMLGRVATLTAAYTQFIASAGLPETLQLAVEMTSRTPALMRRGRERVRKRLQCGDWEAAEELLEFFAERRAADLRSLQRLADLSDHMDFFCAELERQVESERRLWRRAFETGAVTTCANQQTETDREADARLHNRVPVRKHPSPPFLNRLLPRMSEERRRQWSSVEQDIRSRMAAIPLVIYWTDGKRDMQEICRLVELECGIDLSEYIELFFDTLEELNLVEIH